MRVDSEKGPPEGRFTAKAGRRRGSNSFETICLCQRADLCGKVRACKQQRK